MVPKSKDMPEGNLRERLIAAGIAILSRGRALTLRGAAAHAGVSHAAPAHHFSGLAGLETAVAARAFGMFADVLRGEVGTEDEAGPRLMALARTYCDFAVENGTLFHLMFVSDRVDRTDPEVAQAQSEAYGLLRSVCAPLLRDPAEAALVETSLLAMIHGYAMLHHRRPAGHTPVAPPPLEAVLGHAMACLAPPAPRDSMPGTARARR